MTETRSGYQRAVSKYLVWEQALWSATISSPAPMSSAAKKRLLIAALFAALFSFVLAEHSPAQHELDAARDLWTETAPTDFDYSYRWDIGAHGPQSVEVRDGRIATVEPEFGLGNGAAFTIEEMFGVVERGIDQDWDTLYVVYDTVYGFPASITYDIDDKSIDDEGRYTVSGFRQA